MFKALVLNRVNGALSADVRDLAPEDLPDGDVLISVLYSSLNYKDSLAVTGKSKIIRGRFPFVPGIDLVGRVEESASDKFEPGDQVILTGGGLGEKTWGGYSQMQRVPDTYLVPLPEGMTPVRAMELGTAGFTAMLAIMALEQHGITPEQGEIVVSGASGGVGSIALAALAKLGYDVVASSGSADAYDYLTQLGAVRIIHRDELSQGPQRPLESARWAGAIDTVGGTTLSSIISQLGWHGSVAVCGNVGSYELYTTVYPFILRGVNLLGIDSNTATYDQRCEVWKRLCWDLPKKAMDLILAGVIHLDQVPAMCEELIQGGIRGRVVVDVNA